MAGGRTGWAERAAPHALALLALTLLAIAATWPLAANFSTALPSIPAERGQDVWQNAWNFWWTREALLVQHANPYRTDALFFPLGASLYLHSLNLPQSLLGLPLLPVLGIVATYNLVTLLMLVATGYCAFLLARHVSGSAPAALVAAFIVLCSPQRLDELRQSQLPTISDYGLPLALLLALVAVRRRSWRWALATAAAVLVAGLSSWYHLFHLVLLFGLLMLWDGAAALWQNASWRDTNPRSTMSPQRRGERRGKSLFARLCGLCASAVYFIWRNANWREVRTALAPWAQIAGLSALVCAPLLLPAAAEAATAAYAVKGEGLVFSANALRLLPAPGGGVWQAVPEDWVSDVSFAWLPLAGAIAGGLLARGAALRWAAAALACLVLALGPRLLLGELDTGVPLPYELLRLLPVIDSLRAPTRINYVSTLLLALVAALGQAVALRRLPRPAAWLVAGGLSLLVAAETLRLPFPLREGAVSPFYARLAAEPGRWSILELPIDRPDRSMQEMYAQVVHGKPILPGHLSREVPRLPYEAAPPIAQAELATGGDDIVAMSPAERDQLLRGLRARYLVVRPSPGRPARMQQQIDAARQSLGPLSEVYADAELRAFRIDRVAEWLDGAGRAGGVEPPLFAGLDERWAAPERGSFGLSRWLPAGGAGVWAYSQHARRVALDMTLYSLPGARPLEVWLNGRRLSALPIPAGVDPRRYSLGPLDLPAGPSLVELRAPEPGASPASLGLGDDQRVLTFSVHRIALRELGE